VVERYDYSAYGTVTIYSSDWSSTLGSSSVGNTTLYASMVLDPRTGLFYDEARWYDASVSTFVSQDPAMADENLYRYCGNDPLDRVDWTGDAESLGGATSKFSLAGYDGKVEYAMGWPCVIAFDAGIWGQPFTRATGGYYPYGAGGITEVLLWGYDTCNTIRGSWSVNSGAMRISLYLCPGHYTIGWGWSVSGSAAIPPGAQKDPTTGQLMAPGGADVTISGVGIPQEYTCDFGGTKTTLTDTGNRIGEIYVRQSGWVTVAQYSPSMVIRAGRRGGMFDNTRSTMTYLEGALQINMIDKNCDGGTIA
jgi:RHS repeat-associated protein